MRRKNILFVVLPEKGHINPMIGVAKCLRNRQSEIAFFSQEDISNQLTKAGLDCKCFIPNEKPDILDEFLVHGAEFAEKMKDKAWMQLWLKAFIIDAVPSQVEALNKIVESFKPDIIVTDPMMYAAAIVAESNGIPWAGISNSLNPVTPKEWTSDLVETLTKYNGERLALFSTMDRYVDFRIADLVSPWLNVVFTSEAYVPRSLSNNRFSFYVGTPFPLNGNRGDETQFPFDKLDGNRKKVFMSLGSMLYYHPKLFKIVARSLEGLDVQLILSVGDLYHENFADEFTEDTIVLPYVPQLQVLDYVDVMVSHGGANSVIECLSKGIPLALLPMCNDQFFQAEFLERAKAGIVLDAKNPHVESYRKALIQLLEEKNEYRNNAKRIQKSLSDRNGAQEAADLIYQLLSTRKPLAPVLTS